MANWFFSLLGKISGNVAEVDADNQLLVRTNPDPAKAGAVLLYDATGAAILVEENGSLSVSQDELILSEQVDGNALNINKWATSVSGMTIAQGSGFITLNSGSVLTASAYAILSSIMQVPLYGDMPVEFAFNAHSAGQPQSNSVIEMGLGSASAGGTPTDGAFFRWSATGVFQVVVNNAGTETVATCAAPAGSTLVLPPTNNNTQLYSIIISEDHVQFTLDDEIVADITNPPAFAYPVNSGHQPVFARVYNGGSSPTSVAQLAIGQVMVRQISVQTYKGWRDRVASFGMCALQSPITPFAQTANHANSTSPVSATLSNTAAGYMTLGGRWQFAAVGAAATDYALYAFQVPAPFKFYCTGIAISSIVTGVAVATATVLDWAIGINASAVSLATADGAGTWAPRRVPLGCQGFAALAGVGISPSDLVRTFDPPQVVDAGRYLHVILQVPNGAATASLVFRGDVMLQGYFE